MVRVYMFLTLLIVLGLALCGCQMVQPVSATEMESETPTGQIRASIDFTVPEWGLEHGWVSIDMPISDVEEEVAEGAVRWVEVNTEQEVRYVEAVPKCVMLSEDGQAALVAVEITDRWGWGEGEAGQWMQFWLNEAGNEFASPLFPPSDVNPGCEYVAPANPIPLVAGDIAIQAPR